MTALQGYEWALLAAVVLATLEVVTHTYVALSLALGCLAVAAAEYLGGGQGLSRDAIAFAVTAGLAVLVLRRLFAHPGDSKRAEGDVNEF